ncbi:hypothetical protein DOTSEDRAFT_165419 [Dothistroma septosporum NZE10]|uniref:PHD-type domain-containing protein n=1 Tax=Dothistroma septosporum (strain NZE10 / CBS 128990) TaxID=675120 RepID=N1Q3D5_DOTSN|nr:hypothetical protein DOTSEDRAFT_165419 [Dothistroma septosporum NZE10]
MVKLPEYHTLHFYHDNDNACALTALVDGERYHVIADPKRLSDRSKAGKKISNQYRKLLSDLTEAEADEGEEADGTAPLFVTKIEEVDDSSDDTQDSGVDVKSATDEDNDSHDDGPSGALKRWMLSPLKDVFGKSSKSDLFEGRTVQDWYHCPTHFYELHIQDGKLQAEEEASPPASLTKRTNALIPSMPLPKYIRELKIPAIKASDVLVVRESSDPAPIHPALVRHQGNDYFLKVVDINQYKPMKREISVMKRIEAEGLHEEMKVPRLRGLVHFESKDSNKSPHAMGFLMDAIDDPTPLTQMLDSEVPAEKRTKWAEESARMVDLLHQHGIVWGDAKGDNFMVDGNDDLWIIDFGGSYTEGWVDPELNETEEGDQMGVRRLVNGLNDPENNTVNPDEDEQENEEEGAPSEGDGQEQEDQREDSNQGRKAEQSRERTNGDQHDDGDEDDKDEEMLDDADRSAEDSDRPAKQRKTSVEETAGGDVMKGYCYCNGPDSGRMLACDGKECKMQWFHFECVGIEEAPESKKWYCKECRE